MVMKVAYTIVKQIIEKLALLTIKKHWTKNYKISIFKAFFALFFSFRRVYFEFERLSGKFPPALLPFS